MAILSDEQIDALRKRELERRLKNLPTGEEIPPTEVVAMIELKSVSDPNKTLKVSIRDAKGFYEALKDIFEPEGDIDHGVDAIGNPDYWIQPNLGKITYRPVPNDEYNITTTGGSTSAVTYNTDWYDTHKGKGTTNTT